MRTTFADGALKLSFPLRKQGKDVGRSEAEHAHLGDEFRQRDVHEFPPASDQDQTVGFGGDEVAETAFLVDDSEIVHLVVGLEHSAVVDRQRHCQLLGGWYAPAYLPLTRKDAKVAILDYLPENRLGVAEFHLILLSAYGAACHPECKDSINCHNRYDNM